MNEFTTVNPGVLQEVGLRVTPQRLTVLGVLRQGRVHLTADEVFHAAKGQLGSVSVQAVYDALGTLCDHGLARRIEPAKRTALYEARVADNHHHLVCRTCGTVVDVDCAVGLAPCLEASATQGFTIDEAEVTFWGECPTCQADTANAKNG